MPRRSADLQGREPRDFLVGDGAYPDGPWEPATPVLVHYVAAIARSIEAGLADRGWTIAQASRELGIARQTLHDILSGRTVPDLLSVVRAEQALERSVWPGRGAS